MWYFLRKMNGDFLVRWRMEHNQCTVPRAARRMNPTFFLTPVFLFWIRVFSRVTWYVSSTNVSGWNWNISTEEESNFIPVYEVWNTKRTDIPRLKHKNVSNSFNYHHTRLILRLWKRSFFESVKFWDSSFWNSFMKRTMNNSFMKRTMKNIMNNSFIKRTMNNSFIKRTE